MRRPSQQKINESVFWFFAGVVFTIFFCLVAGINFKAKGQDSVTLEVLDFKPKGKKIKYELLIRETGEVVVSYCECTQKRKKGELVKVAKKDLFFKKD